MCATNKGDSKPPKLDAVSSVPCPAVRNVFQNWTHRVFHS